MWDLSFTSSLFQKRNQLVETLVRTWYPGIWDVATSERLGELRHALWTVRLGWAD